MFLEHKVNWARFLPLEELWVQGLAEFSVRDQASGSQLGNIWQCPKTLWGVKAALGGWMEGSKGVMR